MTAGAALADRLEGSRIVICAGPGGVGKTTTAAALALGLAARGQRVAVVTIDPARRLADALGLEELADEPRRIEAERLPGFRPAPGGELWAMTLDAKRTFDDLIERLAPDAAARDQVLSNPIYQQISTAVAGSHEFTAIAKLHDLDAEGDYDVVVLDTPPSRNALDFLDAPGRLTSFFQGRAIRLLMRPAGLGSRLLGAGTGAVFSILQRATGVDLLDDVAAFFRALGGMVDGFPERAARVEKLLADPATRFVLVCSPEPGPRSEALFLAERLRTSGMALAAAVVNRVEPPPGELPAGPEVLSSRLEPALAERVLAAARVQARRAAHDAAGVEALRAGVDGTPVFVVEQLDEDVHDAAGLARVAARLLPLED
ncbi:MAG: Arsenical pump-driving ATPase TEMP [uncultured Solirubrobacteraceae bacterium]|uniref:Arsenical pump-driving ATPase TEMP n=1 Tax=uncultured Solirubrobacteraceae bacterium TaxID=1162706 RepID=A0A6J4S8B2_9ACTN|nr:MAG: Arsenical pump-driving ATPase TEMP [uncultured Solirubrobacteraceae bacterium]